MLTHFSFKSALFFYITVCDLYKYIDCMLHGFFPPSVWPLLDQKDAGHFEDQTFMWKCIHPSACIHPYTYRNRIRGNKATTHWLFYISSTNKQRKTEICKLCKTVISGLSQSTFSHSYLLKMGINRTAKPNTRSEPL